MPSDRLALSHAVILAEGLPHAVTLGEASHHHAVTLGEASHHHVVILGEASHHHAVILAEGGNLLFESGAPMSAWTDLNADHTDKMDKTDPLRARSGAVWLVELKQLENANEANWRRNANLLRAHATARAQCAGRD